MGDVGKPEAYTALGRLLVKGGHGVVKDEAEGVRWLRKAAEQEWAGAALLNFVADPDKFLRRHLELLVEHQRAADLDDSERDFLAGLLAGNPGARSRAEAGRCEGEPS